MPSGAVADIGLLLVAALLFATAVAPLAVEIRRAAAAEARAREAGEFLTSVLEGVGPENVRRSRSEPREVLDDGVRRVRIELAGRPLLQARLFDALGRVYQEWEHYGQARTLLEAGLGLRLRTVGGDHPAVARSRLHLGVLAHELGEPGADTFFTAALAIYRRHMEPADPELRRGLLEYGVVLRDRGEHRAAETLFREVLAPAPEGWSPVGTAWADVPSRPDATTALALAHLGRVLTVREAWAGADSALRGALEARRDLHGPSHPAVADALDALGELELARGAPDAAARRFRRALALRYALLDPEHPAVAGSLHRLALLERARGEARSAEWLLRRSLALTRRAFGPRSPEVAGLLEPLAAVRRELGDAGEAAALYAEALAIWSERGEHLAHPAEVRALLGLAELRLAGAEPGRAEPLLREALAIRERILPPRHWRTAAARGTLGAGLVALDRRPEAEAHLTEAYETLSRTRGVADPRTREVLGHLVELYDRWEGPEGGDRYDRFATALRVRQVVADPR